MDKESLVSRALNRTFYYGFSSILGKVVGFAMLPVYTNYLSPKDYGVAGFLIFYVSLAQVLLGGKLEHAISKFYYDKERSDSLVSILIAATLFTMVLASIPLLISIAFSGNISEFLFDSNEYELAVKIISFNILFGTLELYGLQYVKIIDMPRFYLALNLIKLIVQLVINIVLVVYLDFGVLGVVVSSAVATVLITMLCALTILVRENKFQFNTKLIPNLFSYSAPLWLSGLLGLYSGSSSQVYIKEFANLSDLGLYNLAATFGALVGTLLWTPFFSFWSVERFRIYEREDAKLIFKKVFYCSAGVSLFFGFGIAVFSDPVIRIMAAEDFHAASSAVAPLAIFNIIMFLGWYLNFSFLVTNNNKEIARNGFVYAVLITIAFLIAVPRWGFVGAAYGLMVATLLNLHIIELRARKYYDLGVSIFIVDLMVIVTLILIWGFSQANVAFSDPLLAVAINSGLVFLLVIFVLLVIRLFMPDVFKQGLSILKFKGTNL